MAAPALQLSTEFSELGQHEHSQTTNTLFGRTAQTVARNMELDALRLEAADLRPYKMETLTLRNENAKLKNELADTKQSLETAKGSLETVKAEIETLKGEYDQTRAQLLLLVDTKRDIEAKLEIVSAAETEHARLTRDFAIKNTRLEYDLCKAKDEILNYEMNTNILKHKISLLVQNSEMKQKMIKGFEQRISGQYNLSVDNRSLAALREFQATRLRELFEKSKKHLELERKQNDVLRKNLEESANATIVSALRNDVASLKEELYEVRGENVTLKSLQKRQEKLLRQAEKRLEEMKERE